MKSVLRDSQSKHTIHCLNSLHYIFSEKCMSARIMLKSGRLREIYAALVCYHGAVLYGLDMAFTSYIVESPDGFSVLQEGILGSASILFRGIGAFVSACVVDRFGRKQTLFAGFGTSGLAWITIFFSSTFELLLIGRILSGISIALSYSSNVSYVAEISDKSRRGTLIALRAVIISFGMNVVTITASFCHWKWIGVIGLAVCASGGAQLINLPETKYWLMLNGRRSDALKSAIWFSPTEKVESIEAELNEIENSFSMRGENVSMWAIFSSKTSLKTLVCCFALVILLGGTCRMAIVTHIEHFIISFQHAFDSQKLVVFLNVLELFICVFYMLVVDKFDRKNILYFTLYVMAFTLSGILFHDLELRRFGISTPAVPICLLFAYLLIAVTGLMACMVIVFSEIVTNENKGSILSLTNCLGSLVNAACSAVLPFVLKYIDVHFTVMYFLIHVVLLIMFVRFILPETRGKALHECGLDSKQSKNTG